MPALRPRSTLHLGIALFLFCASMTAAENEPAPAAPIRLAVATKIASTCRDAIAAPPISQDAVAQLESAGVRVSDIHNAELTVDVDCLPLARPHGASSAVHQCLGFSEMVAPASNGGRTMLATTWRQCQSYTCSRA